MLLSEVCIRKDRPPCFTPSKWRSSIRTYRRIMSVAANRYARALMDVLSAENAEAGFEQLQSFAAVLQNEPDATRILENPTISADRRKVLLREIGSALRFSKPVSNLLDLL